MYMIHATYFALSFFEKNLILQFNLFVFSMLHDFCHVCHVYRVIFKWLPFFVNDVRLVSLLFLVTILDCLFYHVTLVILASILISLYFLTFVLSALFSFVVQ